MRRSAAAVIGVIGMFTAMAQVDDEQGISGSDEQGALRDLIEQRIEAVAEQLGENSDFDFTALTERLLDLAKSPIDLNRTDAQELASLQLLSDVQISALIEHQRRFGPLLSLYELQAVDAVDPRTIALIRPFVKVRDNINATHASLKEILKNGSHELMLRTQLNIEQRKGFLGHRNVFGLAYTDPDGGPLPDVSDARILDSLRLNNKVYLGSPYKLYARYRFKYRQNISFGITAEKDEGEELFKGTQPDGFDFYSAHLFVRNMGPVKALALGDYTAQFGQGLVFWSGLAYGSKSAFTMNVKRNAAGLLPYSSVNENLFMRGAAVTVEVAKNLVGTAFFSHKNYDANVPDPNEATALNPDGDAQFSALLNDGYHRTYTEVARKDAITETLLGGHLRFKKPTWSLGATVANTRFSNALVRNVRPYNQFEFQGSENTVFGADWNVLYRNLTWFGEGAHSANGGLAGMTGLLVALDKRLSLALLYRDYQRGFQNLYSVPFGASGSPWNERGLYTGIELKANRQWQFNAYFDQFRFPWLRSLRNAPSDGYDVLGQLAWTPSKKVQVSLRARYQNGQINGTRTEGIDPLVRQSKLDYRFNASYKVDENITLRTRIESVDYTRGNDPVEHGFLIYQDLIHRPLRSKVEFTARVAVFSSDTYDARLYAYENDIQGLFSIPPYYGRGMRWYAMARWSIMRGVDVWVRYGAWIYNGQDRISSGLEETTGNRKSDLKLELRVKL
jgi:DNA uptake protein ComE-like DNA-binding protein